MAEIQYDLYNYLSVEMIDYNRFMIRRVEEMRSKIVDSDDDYVDDKNPLFGRINGVPICRIALHITPTKNSSNKRDRTDN